MGGVPYQTNVLVFGLLNSNLVNAGTLDYGTGSHLSI